MLNKTKEVRKTDKPSGKQYIALAICTAAMIVLIYVVPALAVLENLLPAVIVGISCIVTMGVSVFKGGLTDVSGE